MSSYNYDAVIIGGGPAGYVAAIQLAKAGARVAIIEKDAFGGTCLNRGCIPTKTLYHYAKLLYDIEKSQTIGLSVQNVTLNMEQVYHRKEEIVYELVSGIEQLLEANNVDKIAGSGSFITDHEIEVTIKGTKTTVTSEYIIIATGSKPKLVPIDGLTNGLKEGYVLTSKEILNLQTIPASLTIIGGGVIGMEFATIFNQFGSQVTVIEALDHILPTFSPDLIKRYKPFIKSQGIQVLTNSLAKTIQFSNNKAVVTVKGPKETVDISSELVLLAVGRVSNTDGLNESAAHIVNLSETDDFMRTNQHHIYSVGDVNGKSMLAHSASKQGIIVANDISIKLGLIEENEIKHKGFSHYAVPNCAFLLPEIAEVSDASVFKTLTKDKKLLKQAHTGSFNFRSNGMAKALNSEEGLCKTIFHKDKLVFMGLIGETSSELIMEGVHFIDEKIENQNMDSIVAHPSLNEIIHESILDAYKKAIHKI